MFLKTMDFCNKGVVWADPPPPPTQLWSNTTILHYFTLPWEEFSKISPMSSLCPKPPDNPHPYSLATIILFYFILLLHLVRNVTKQVL